MLRLGPEKGGASGALSRASGSDIPGRPTTCPPATPDGRRWSASQRPVSLRLRATASCRPRSAGIRKGRSCVRHSTMFPLCQRLSARPIQSALNGKSPVRPGYPQRPPSAPGSEHPLFQRRPRVPGPMPSHPFQPTENPLAKPEAPIIQATPRYRLGRGVQMARHDLGEPHCRIRPHNTPRRNSSRFGVTSSARFRFPHRSGRAHRRRDA